MSLQFVQDCSDAKKLVCLIEQNCGYLCQLYSVNVCYIAASYQNRTVILKYLDYSSLEDKQKVLNWLEKLGLKDDETSKLFG